MSNNQQALTVARTPKELMSFLTGSRSAIEMALPKHLNPDRMIRLALTCFSTTPALRNCTPQSILASIVVASQLGLEPGVAGQAYLIPYKTTCTLVPGWQGLVGLLNNSGRATAWTGCVFEGDEWEFELGSAPRCRHVPGPNFGDPEKMIWAYACGKVNGSEQAVVEAWPVSRVWRHRDRYNKVGQKHYSYENPEMYARKVVLLQVLKYMPRSIELNNAITAADAAEKGNSTIADGGVIIEVEPDNTEPQPAKPVGNTGTAANAKQQGPFKAAESEATGQQQGQQPNNVTELKQPPKPPEPPKETEAATSQTTNPPAPAGQQTQKPSPSPTESAAAATGAGLTPETAGEIQVIKSLAEEKNIPIEHVVGYLRKTFRMAETCTSLEVIGKVSPRKINQLASAFEAWTPQILAYIGGLK